MPKARKTKRKTPITSTHIAGTSTSTVSNKPSATRGVIRKFHVLKKRQTQLQRVLSEGSTSLAAVNAQKELKDIERKMEELGGLEAYQKMSAIGQGKDRGGGSERVLLSFLSELGYPKDKQPEARWKVLEVGALKPDNYASCTSWMDVTPIDLHSRHPAILEQDFLAMDEAANTAKWDLISLSLVVNFVPDVEDRGRMLRLAWTMLRTEGFLFLALPLPCIMNSRYMTAEHLTNLMATISFTQLKSRWKDGGKMAYWLFQKSPPPKAKLNVTPFRKKTVLRTGGNRNNFCILL